MEQRSGTGGMAGQEVGELTDALRDLGSEAREAVGRLAEQLELERRMEESPMAVLGVAAAAGFVLGGGLWPVLRPFLKAAVRTALSPANLLAIGAAVGAMRAAQGRDDGSETTAGSASGETH
ncbi:hypothetical protein [Anaeromyxobacter oryzae]|uniref:Uncharacterized protein n=1 Tax=Anaeromyxobacter oryzae TaxID=2918170 RepID=A0ABM7WQ78_9BACT|nr:hypothetical protein [Anaeromyxobacter oryzae]BDG01615.1 hypothetical protein AMOR_06110 [Anaeromyxobacter oryzae]